MRGINILSITLIAAATIKPLTFMRLDGTPGGEGDAVAGVTRFGGAVDDGITVDALGTTQVEVGGAVSVGDGLHCGADARAVAGGTGPVVARAMSAADNAGDIVDVLLIPH